MWFFLLCKFSYGTVYHDGIVGDGGPEDDVELLRDEARLEDVALAGGLEGHALDEHVPEIEKGYKIIY